MHDIVINILKLVHNYRHDGRLMAFYMLHHSPAMRVWSAAPLFRCAVSGGWDHSPSTVHIRKHVVRCAVDLINNRKNGNCGK